MGFKKLDSGIRTLIDNGVTTGHRSMFIIFGAKARDQVVILHHMLSRATIRSRPSVLWCYKKELGFSTHRKKRMRQLQKKIRSGKLDVNEDDPFEQFVSATNIRYCYYSETHKILGNTYGMLVLQDFEAMTPNLLARTIETVEGGGLVVILLHNVSSVKQLYTMAMDVHARYRTEAHQDVVGRFNMRFVLSLGSCKQCLVVDDQLNILPKIYPTKETKGSIHLTPIPKKPKEESLSPSEQELETVKESLQDTQPVGSLVNLCRTLDQANALLKFIDVIAEKTLSNTVTLTAARGRGKSAALGLAIAGAVAFGYCNIFVTSPSPENLKTLFEFVLKGFDAINYQEHMDYELIQSTNPEFNKALVRINVFRDHRQTIQYIHPTDAHKLGQAELVVIDEAAAIPLPLVKNLLGPYLVFMASTINGYEGTGRSLSLKLIQQLRQQNSTFSGGLANVTKLANNALPAASGRKLHEVTLNESIRYKAGDEIESWLNQLLCLDATTDLLLSSGCPAPQECQLYYINRDSLISYKKTSETFLQRIMSLYVSSHYKNSPNDLQMMSDAPAHHLFCLLPPVELNTRITPDVLCVVQVCLEGEISKNTVMESLSRGKRASGDLIPWTVSQQFQDAEFASLSGARIVRIATHPDYQKMGYGTRAIELLQEYFEGKFVRLDEGDDTEKEKKKHGLSVVEDDSVNLLEESVTPKNLPPLLEKLSDRPPEKLDYMGVSYGMTADLLKFWKKVGFVPVYLRQTPNELTGEHSCIMLKLLNEDESKSTEWLVDFWTDFRRRFVSLLSYQFHIFKASLGLSVLDNEVNEKNQKELSKEDLLVHMTLYDVKRLELYSQNLVDYHLIVDLLPALARFYFLKQLGSTHLSSVQAAILLSMGLQRKTVDEVSKELELPATQILGLFNRTIRRLTQYLMGIVEHAIEETLPQSKEVELEPVAMPLHKELAEAARQVEKKQKKELEELLKDPDLSQYAIKGSEEEWERKLSQNKTLISIKSIKKTPISQDGGSTEPPKKKFKKGFKKTLMSQDGGSTEPPKKFKKNKAKFKKN